MNKGYFFSPKGAKTLHGQTVTYPALCRKHDSYFLTEFNDIQKFHVSHKELNIFWKGLHQGNNKVR